jgi:hypoxanthine phosphoribosyltransferase
MSEHQIHELYSPQEYQEKIQDIAKKIISDFSAEKEIVIIGVMKGAFIFLADLVRLLPNNYIVDMVGISSYGSGTLSSGRVTLLRDIDVNILGKCVLIVEDIVDSGRSLHYLQDHLKLKGAKLIKSCVLLSKPIRRQVRVHIDYLGFEIDDHFVIGLGLDFDGKYRGLPYIGYLES